MSHPSPVARPSKASNPRAFFDVDIGGERGGEGARRDPGEPPRPGRCGGLGRAAGAALGRAGPGRTVQDVGGPPAGPGAALRATSAQPQQREEEGGPAANGPPPPEGTGLKNMERKATWQYSARPAGAGGDAGGRGTPAAADPVSRIPWLPELPILGSRSCPSSAPGAAHMCPPRVRCAERGLARSRPRTRSPGPRHGRDLPQHGEPCLAAGPAVGGCAGEARGNWQPWFSW